MTTIDLPLIELRVLHGSYVGRDPDTREGEPTGSRTFGRGETFRVGPREAARVLRLGDYALVDASVASTIPEIARVLRALPPAARRRCMPPKEST
jgi:hypothetical protein